MNERKRKVQISIGTPEDMGRRFVDAWRRAERGEAVDEEHLTFRNLETLLAALTPKRIELLRWVRNHPGQRIADVARGLERDYKRVHEDVGTLAGIGLISRTGKGLEVPYEEVDARLVL